MPEGYRSDDSPHYRKAIWCRSLTRFSSLEVVILNDKCELIVQAKFVLLCAKKLIVSFYIINMLCFVNVMLRLMRSRCVFLEPFISTS